MYKIMAIFTSLNTTIMIRYLIRFVKYIIYLSLLASILLALVFYLSDHGDYRYFWELIPASNQWYMALFLLAFAAINPFISYVDRKVYLNQTFSHDREQLIDVILKANYQIKSDSQNQLVFRHKNPLTRFIRMYEDTIILDYSDNPIVLKGQRRDIDRFARSMEFIIKN